MISVVAVSCLGFARAFTPAFTPRLSAQRLTESKTQLYASYLSEISGDDDKKPAYLAYQEELAGKTSEGVNPDGNYEGLVDGDTFDGGDGQTGVVGDGSNNMEQFDQSGTVTSSSASTRIAGNMVGGGESKKTQKNAFGTFTGYADSLKDSGMEAIDEYGEDRLMARRQQLENWRNQRELKAQQNSGLAEMAAYTGVEYDQRRATQSYFNALDKGTPLDDDKWNVYQGDKKADSLTEAAQGLAAGPITQTIEMSCAFPKPSFHTILVENDVMTYEEFVVGFAPESDNGGADFQITPLSGELNRRGGEPQELNVVFKPQAPGGAPRNALVVVETEESKFTYQIIGTVM